MTWQYWRDTRSLKLAEYKFFGVGSGQPGQRSAPNALRIAGLRLRGERSKLSPHDAIKAPVGEERG